MFPAKTARWLLAGVCAVYLLLALAYSRWTPAWEANDERDHLANMEQILSKGLWPIEFASVLQADETSGYFLRWHESHQPPLYYALGAVWQHALGIPPFIPFPLERTALRLAGGEPSLAYHHDYNRLQRTQAQWLHRLRLLSVVLGLGTVLLTYAAARAASAGEDAALASAAFVACLPKFAIVSAVVTNDALVICLSSAALVLLLRYVSGTQRPRRVALAIGLVSGAAAITKLNSLPLIPVLFAGVWLARRSWQARLVDTLLGASGFLAVAGWWFARNQRLYGDPLARQASEDWLRICLPSLIDPVSWSDRRRFIELVPETFVQSAWYNAGWNQFTAPLAWNLALSALAVLTVAFAVAAYARGRTADGRPFDGRAGLLLVAVVLAGVVAVLIIAQRTTQAEGRIAYVGLSAFAVLTTLGTQELVASCTRGMARRLALFAWPVALLALHAYVFTRVLIPFGGL
jgi:4-amino-4-deoxy-L-arabinose transferase-like glycosyltransferase